IAHNAAVPTTVIFRVIRSPPRLCLSAALAARWGQAECRSVVVSAQALPGNSEPMKYRAAVRTFTCAGAWSDASLLVRSSFELDVVRQRRQQRTHLGIGRLHVRCDAGLLQRLGADGSNGRDD